MLCAAPCCCCVYPSDSFSSSLTPLLTPSFASSLPIAGGRAKGLETEDTIDHTKIAQYGSVDVRRKKGGDADDDIRGVTDEDLQKIQDEIDRNREEELRAVAEKELQQKEKQLVSRRLGNMELDRKKGFVHRIGR